MLFLLSLTKHVIYPGRQAPPRVPFATTIRGSGCVYATDELGVGGYDLVWSDAYQGPIFEVRFEVVEVDAGAQMTPQKPETGERCESRTRNVGQAAVGPDGIGDCPKG